MLRPGKGEKTKQNILEGNRLVLSWIKRNENYSLTRVTSVESCARPSKRKHNPQRPKNRLDFLICLSSYGKQRGREYRKTKRKSLFLLNTFPTCNGRHSSFLPPSPSVPERRQVRTGRDRVKYKSPRGRSPG